MFCVADWLIVSLVIGGTYGVFNVGVVVYLFPMGVAITHHCVQDPREGAACGERERERAGFPW